MKRLIARYLVIWKDKEHRKPLIIRGARQVGKTYSVNEFGSKSFSSYVKIDFERQIKLRDIFNEDLSPDRLIKLLELATGLKIIAGETLLFFDEIQCCPKALASLRYFYEEMPQLHIVAAGSLLEFEMDKISFPVGRVEFMYMYPMTFEEFLINSGSENLDHERPCLGDEKPVNEFIHSSLMDKLKEYFVVGGMPEAVKLYLETGSLIDVYSIHESLINSLVSDMLKYEKNVENDLIRELLETIPAIYGSAVKFTHLSQTASQYKIKQALTILEKSLLVTFIKSSSAAGLPLGGQINKSSFKLSFVDIGIMQHLAGISAADVIQADDLLATYKGTLSEQFIAQELKAVTGSQNNQLYYWSRSSKSSNAEVDFLITHNGKIFPIEVKNGPAGSLKSLHLFLKEHPEISKGFVLNSGNIGVVGNIHFMPLYTRFK